MSDYAYLVLTVRRELKLIETDSPKFSLDNFYRAIPCDSIEIVRPVGLPRYTVSSDFRPYLSDLLMVIDEEGKLVDKPLNVLASLMYAYPQDVIVGDVVIGWTNPLEIVESDVYPFPYDIALKVAEGLRELSLDLLRTNLILI